MGGFRVGLPAVGSARPQLGQGFGIIAGLTGTTVAAMNMHKVKGMIVEMAVPRPNMQAPSNKRPQKHDVYQIFAVDRTGETYLYKYGITKNYPQRPRSQLRACRNYFGVTRCDYRLLRKDLKNRGAARTIEAYYFARYKMRTGGARDGRCPPGAAGCL